MVKFISEVKQHLLEPELMLMLSTGRLLQAVAQGSSAACCQVLDTTIPMLTETHSKQTEVIDNCSHTDRNTYYTTTSL